MNQIVGNPVPCKVGRKVCLIGYVSMGEYQVFRDMFQEDEAVAVLELVYYSLRRGGSIRGNIKRKIRRMIKKDPAILLTMVNLICELSLPDVKTKKGEAETSDEGENIKTVYRLLAKFFTWTPPQITDMSPAQIYISMTGGPDGTGTRKMSWGQFAEERAKRGLT